MQRRTSTIRVLVLGAATTLAACEPTLPAEDVVIAASSYDDRLHVLEPATGRRVERIEADPRADERDGPAGVAVSPDGSEWYVVLGEGEPSLWVFSGLDGSPLRTIPLPNLRHASRVAVSPDGGRAIVTEYLLSEPIQPGRTTIIDLRNGTEVATGAPCSTPYDVAFSRRGDQFAVTCPLSDEVVIFDAESLEVTARFTVTSEDVPAGVTGNPSSRPMGLEWAPGGDRLYVALFQERRLGVFTPDGAAFTQYDLGGAPVNVDVRGRGRYAVVAIRDEPALAVVDLRSREVSTLPLADVTAPHDVTLSPDGSIAYVAYEGSPTEPGGVVAVDLDAGAVLWNTPAGPMTTGIVYRAVPPSLLAADGG